MILHPEASMTHEEEKGYKMNIENLFKKIDVLKRDNSFKNQMGSSV